MIEGIFFIDTLNNFLVFLIFSLKKIIIIINKVRPIENE